MAGQPLPAAKARRPGKRSPRPLVAEALPGEPVLGPSSAHLQEVPVT